ncbi:MAG TPA: iron-containing alcohol dehydrogenase [Devosia sp.]|nr:iron-containing alcohol dehydrogenase [Devosia sp.]
MPDWQTELREIVEPAVKQSATIRQLLVERGAIQKTGAMVRSHFDGNQAILFADEAGFSAAGDPAVQSLKAEGFGVTTHIIPAAPLPKASVELAETFRPLLEVPGPVPIALGSGVINDLVKYAAYRESLPYFSIATAASMDGYASAGAPLVREGFKITIPTSAPRAILADLDIIAAAPDAMTSWGYGDLAGKVPAGGDWILADALGVEPLDDLAWPLVQNHLSGWLANPAALARGDFSAIARLFAGLSVVGLAMEFHGSSRPASGADHQIAHLWEMEGLQFDGRHVSHGACVAVGCMTTLAMYDWLIEQDLSTLDPARIISSAPTLGDKYALIDATFDDARIIRRAREETRAKHLAPEALGERLETLVSIWPDLQARLSSHLMRAPDMAKLLRAAGAPVNASDIGVSPGHLRETFFASRFIRSRYTLPDLLEEAGLLNRAVDTVIVPPMFAAE